MSGLDLNPIVFDDVVLLEVPATIGGKEYVLREASGGAAARYRNAMIACTELGEGGNPKRIHGIADTEILLVHECLFVKDKDVKVAQEIIKRWPRKVVKTLYDRVKQISDLQDSEDLEDLEKQKAELEKKIADKQEAEDPAKKERSDLTDGSD